MQSFLQKILAIKMIAVFRWVLCFDVVVILWRNPLKENFVYLMTGSFFAATGWNFFLQALAATILFLVTRK